MRTKKPEKKPVSIGGKNNKGAPAAFVKKRDASPHACSVCGATGMSEGGYLMYSPTDSSFGSFAYFCVAHKPAVAMPRRDASKRPRRIKDDAAEFPERIFEESTN